MKNVIVSALAVALLAAGVCAFSSSTVSDVCGEMQWLRAEAVQLLSGGQSDEAAKKVEQMRKYWDSRCSVLTAILPHGAVAEIGGVLIESSADLSAGERDEFEGDMLLLGELLRRMEEEERLILSNILSIC